ncbi:MAG: N-acetyltransferase [Armatimonadetes bacterium]|nr:MAG: N-acetyltransferase [Armatimonadota bacterium]
MGKIQINIVGKSKLLIFSQLRFLAHQYAAQFDKDIVIEKNTPKFLDKLTKEEFDDPRIVYLSADDEEKMIGIAILSLPVGIDSSAYLGELFVIQDYRGAGIGSKLVDKAIKITKERGLNNFQNTVAWKETFSPESKLKTTHWAG